MNKGNLKNSSKNLDEIRERKKQAKLDKYSQQEYKLHKIEETKRSKGFPFDKNLSGSISYVSVIFIITTSADSPTSRVPPVIPAICAGLKLMSLAISSADIIPGSTRLVHVSAAAVSKPVMPNGASLKEPDFSSFVCGA